MINSFRQRFRNWAFRRTIESGTVELNQRRIYIIPTSQGFGFAGVLLLMLLGDINYNLSLGYVLTFLLATTGGMSMLHTYRNLVKLQIRAGHIEPVFAGEDALFVFHFNNPGALLRHQIHLHDDDEHHVVFDLPAGQETAIRIGLPSSQRGWMDSGRLTLHTNFPFGLFHAWSYLHFDVRALIYPKPAAMQALPPSPGGDGTGTQNAAGDDDFYGLRNYMLGDAAPRIAWKTWARAQGLQVKQFISQQGQTLWLDWALLGNVDAEQKLEILTRWVLDADAQGLHYGLRLPDSEIAPQSGTSQRLECMRRLALYGIGDKE